jgi:hypothetical protein
MAIISITKNNKYINDDTFKKDMKSNSSHRGFLFMLVFMLLIVGISYVGAQENLGVFKQNSVVRLLQTCSVCDYITLDSVKLPNSTLIIYNQNMTQSGSTFYYDFSATDLLGDYIYNTHSGNYTAPVEFLITYTGDKITTEQSYVYIIALVALVIFALGLWFTHSRINGEHSRDESGAVVLINFKRFLKPILLVGIWLVTLVSIFIISNLGIAFLPNAMVGNLFFTIYKVLFWATVIALPVSFIFMLVKIVKSIELQKMIDRGVEIRNDKL